MKRVLLDENIDRKLKRSFDPSYEVITVPERGWSGKKNGELLSAAELEFDVLIRSTKICSISRTYRNTL